MTLKFEHLLGKQFIWGASDCLSMFRDFYADNFGIKITNYARPSNWSSDKLDLMRLCYEREGFNMLTQFRLKDLRPGDVLCMSIGERNPNHFAIVLEGDQFMHHLYGRMSVADTLTPMWVDKCAFILRHPDVPDLRPVYPDVDILELINARNATRPE